MVKNWIAALAVAVSACGSSLPQPCDPEAVTAQVNGMAVQCRLKAEQNCPGYDKMSDTEKMACPGVAECLDEIDAVEESCRGR